MYLMGEMDRVIMGKVRGRDNVAVDPKETEPIISETTLAKLADYESNNVESWPGYES